MIYTFAKLDDAQVNRIRDFEARTNVKVLALEEVQLDAAPIDAAQLAELQQLENGLSVCLVAVC